MRHDSSSAALLGVIRTELRKSGWTILRLAQELSVGEATIKRWLAGKGLTIDRLERLAALADLTFSELARLAEDGPQDLAHELTLAQENALSADIFLSFLFMAILSGIQPTEIMHDFDLSPGKINAALVKLERLALIDKLRQGRVRPLVDRALIYRKIPLRSMFELHMKHLFFEIDYASPDTRYASEMVKLSEAGAAQVAEMIERLRGEIQALSDRDRQITGLPQQWYTTLAVMRSLDPDVLRNTDWYQAQ